MYISQSVMFDIHTGKHRSRPSPGFVMFVFHLDHIFTVPLSPCYQSYNIPAVRQRVSTLPAFHFNIIVRATLDSVIKQIFPIFFEGTTYVVAWGILMTNLFLF